MIKGLPFKKIDKKVLEHPLEKRGLVSVPFDYSKPDLGSIEIFYRLIPTYGSHWSDSSKPVIVVINGGPGIPSSFYRPLEFDYENPKSPKNGYLDRFKFFLKTHRVLIADQRGTDGNSAPLDMEDSSLNANLVAKYFSADSHALDYLAVINTVIPQGEKFYVVGQSYGGMPTMQYLGLKDMRKPDGIVFSASALPYEDIVETSLSRRREQLTLNLHIKKFDPVIDSKLNSLRGHFEKVGIDPVRVHNLYTWLGKGEKGVWEKAFVERVEGLLKKTKGEIEADTDKLDEVNVLNYILSSCNFSPGYTDRTLARIGFEKLPFESWMIDENVMVMTTGQDGTWKQKFINDFDETPPPATVFPSIEELRASIGKNKVLFTPADNDAFLPADNYIKSLAKFEVAGATTVKRLPGGHSAIFLEKGYEELLKWANH